MLARSALFGGLGLYLVYELTRKVSAAGNLIFSADKVHSFRFDGLTPVFRIGIRVQNTNNKNFVINSFAANVECEGYVVGNASFFNQQVITANSQVILLVDFRLSTFDLVNRLIQSFQNKDFSYDIKLVGAVNVDGFQVPLSLNYKVGI